MHGGAGGMSASVLEWANFYILSMYSYLLSSVETGEEGGGGVGLKGSTYSSSR